MNCRIIHKRIFVVIEKIKIICMFQLEITKIIKYIVVQFIYHHLYCYISN